MPQGKMSQAAICMVVVEKGVMIVHQSINPLPSSLLWRHHAVTSDEMLPNLFVWRVSGRENRVFFHFKDPEESEVLNFDH